MHLKVRASPRWRLDSGENIFYLPWQTPLSSAQCSHSQPFSLQQKSASQSRSRSHAKHCKSTKWSLPAAQRTAMKWYISSCCMQKIFRYVAEFKMVRMMLNVGPLLLFQPPHWSHIWSGSSGFPPPRYSIIFLPPLLKLCASLRNLKSDNFLFCSEADRSPVLHKQIWKTV